jgi:hypothetical protein
MRLAILLAAVLSLAGPAPARGQSLELAPADVGRLRAYHERIVEAVRGMSTRASIAQLVAPVMALAAERSSAGSPRDENRIALLAIAFYVGGRPLSVLTPDARDWPRAERRRLRLGGRIDLSQHFTISAALSAAAGAPAANLIGLYKEMDDARRGSGFSFVDLAADRAGTALGRLATESDESARRLQARLGADLLDRHLLPAVDGLPDGMSSREFERRYRGGGTAAYDRLVAEIDRRIATLPMYEGDAPRYTRVYPLSPGEGVFAYSRISPSGRFLAYASEMRNAAGLMSTTQTVVDLETQEVIFSEPGIDAYWSLDGGRMIYLSQARQGGVTIRHHATGALTRDVAPSSLGDYFSWAQRDGRDLILTIRGNYYYLDGDKAALPAGSTGACPAIGRGDRPLISKDGRRITAFVRGRVVVRSLTDCENIIDTGLQGGKADFSWDGRYIAFHVPREDDRGYRIAIVDLEQRTVRMLDGLAGSALFPSWTRDGRLSFRYDGDDYRGFMIADNVLAGVAQPLPPSGDRIPPMLRWSDVFPETLEPDCRVCLVLIYASWSAHTPDALRDLQEADREFRASHQDVGVMTAIELSSLREDVDRLRREGGITLPEIPLAPDRLALTEALNQIPTTLLFRDGVLIDQRLGAQTVAELRQWVAQAAAVEREATAWGATAPLHVGQLPLTRRPR